jgi:hypothetical protein
MNTQEKLLASKSQRNNAASPMLGFIINLSVRNGMKSGAYFQYNDDLSSQENVLSSGTAQCGAAKLRRQRIYRCLLRETISASLPQWMSGLRRGA